MQLTCKILLFVICMPLSLVTWPLLMLLALIMAFTENNSDFPSFADVYRHYRQTVTEATRSIAEFVKREIL